MQDSKRIATAHIGIIGGGQLARMMAVSARRLGCAVSILDPDPDAPAMALADYHIEASYHDAKAIRQLVKSVDACTVDLENVDSESLLLLQQEGHRIVPDPALLSTIQDKRKQKKAFREKGIPTAAFQDMPVPTEEAFAAFGYPLVHKAGKGGYDGKGVSVLASAAEWSKHLPVPGLVERMVQFDKELAVLVARSSDGSSAVYDPVEMVFVPEANVLDLLLAPARISKELAEKAQQTALQAIEALDGVGLFGVELFLLNDGEILVNEIAPRTHNSGHHTIEACDTDQFEQHLRAVLGLPLGSTELLRPAALVNLLGADSGSGTPQVHGLPEALAIPGLHVHLYGKRYTKPFRKMGHATAIAATPESAMEKARKARALLRIAPAQTAPTNATSDQINTP
jgi:5-(carboxyamino)imidazole ribonucleotide synthase